MTPKQRAEAASVVALAAARECGRGSLWRIAGTCAAVALTFGSVRAARQAVIEYFGDRDDELLDAVLAEIDAAVAAVDDAAVAA